MKIADKNASNLDDKYGWTLNTENNSYILTVYVGTVEGEKEVKYSILEKRILMHIRSGLLTSQMSSPREEMKITEEILL